MDVNDLIKLSNTLSKMVSEITKNMENFENLAKEKESELTEEERVLYNAEMQKIKEVKDKISKEVNTIKNTVK